MRAAEANASAATGHCATGTVQMSFHWSQREEKAEAALGEKEDEDQKQS